jgi:acid phosphatase type 7
LGQTGWTKSTLQHIAAADYDMLLLPGDLSYADYIQTRWDSYGRLVQQLASARPWMVTLGNHEVERLPVVEPRPFKAYNTRWRMPRRRGRRRPRRRRVPTSSTPFLKRKSEN